MKISHLFGARGPFLLLTAVTCASLPPHMATAHEGDRVVPILEITDDMLSQIDLRDGTTDEWPDLLGEPTLRTIDFQMDSEFFSTEYDPADFDFAIWLGWHEELDRIYLAGAFVDNAYWGTGHPPYGTNASQDKISLGVDGDHSGPITADFFDYGESAYRSEIQFYMATPWISEGPTVIIPYITHVDENLEPLGDWMIHPPYCEAGENVIEGNPTIWSMEFFVTPFDLLVALEPDESVVSDLTAGEVIGLYVDVYDKDQVGQDIKWYSLLDTDAILLSRDQADSVIRDRTWGRIKAALEVDR